MRKKKTAKIIIEKRKYFETTNINSAMIIVYDMTTCINTKKKYHDLKTDWLEWINRTFRGQINIVNQRNRCELTKRCCFALDDILTQTIFSLNIHVNSFVFLEISWPKSFNLHLNNTSYYCWCVLLEISFLWKTKYKFR